MCTLHYAKALKRREETIFYPLGFLLVSFLHLFIGGKKMANELKQRLDKGPVICAEGFLFEIERRGYMAS